MSAQGWSVARTLGVIIVEWYKTLKGFSDRLTLSALYIIFIFATQGSRYAPTLG